MMKLPFRERKADRKSESKQLRRQGFIPAVIYGKGDACEHVAIDGAAFAAALRQIVKGRLATTRFSLTDEKGDERSAIVKDIQYHPTTYDILHLDFEILHENVPVNVRVVIEPVGMIDCVGIKLGGVLRQVLRTLRIRCLPKYIPEAFQLNIKDLKMRDSLRLNDIALPEEVRPLESLDRIALAIVKR